MSAGNITPDTSAHPSTDRPTCPGRAGSNPDHSDHTHGTTKDTATYELTHSRIRLELRSNGVFARITRSGEASSPEYAGPLPQETLDALWEVAMNGD